MAHNELSNNGYKPVSKIVQNSIQPPAAPKIFTQNDQEYSSDAEAEEDEKDSPEEDSAEETDAAHKDSNTGSTLNNRRVEPRQ